MRRLRKAIPHAARAEYAAALAAEAKGRIDRANVEMKLQDVGGDVPAASSTASAAKRGPLMVATRIVSASCWRRRRATALLMLVGCDNDKEVDPPAELTEIIAKRDVHRVWSASLGGDSERLRLALKPVVVDGRVYAASHDGEVAAFSADSGKRNWMVKTKLSLSAGPEVASGLIVLGSSDGDVIALDATNGARAVAQVDRQRSPGAAAGRERHRRHSHCRWSRRRSVGRRRRDQVGGRRAGAAAHVARHGAAGARGRSHHRRLRQRQSAGDRSAQRRSDVGHDRERAARPHRTRASRGHRFAGARRRATIFSSSASRAASRCWRATPGRSGGRAMLRAIAASPWTSENLYLTNSDSVVIAMRRSDGAVLWEQDAMKRRGLTAPAIDGDALVVGDFEGYLHWLDKATGAIVARQKTDGERITNAAVIDRRRACSCRPIPASCWRFAARRRRNASRRLRRRGAGRAALPKRSPSRSLGRSRLSRSR